MTPEERVQTLDEARRAVTFAARLLKTELGPGGLTNDQYALYVQGWTEAMEYLETAMSDPNAAMFTVFHWRHGFKEDWKEEGNGMDHPS